jgi:hypothetical protein
LGSETHLGLSHLLWFQRNVVELMCATLGEEHADVFARHVTKGVWRVPAGWARPLCDVMYDTQTRYQSTGDVCVELQGDHEPYFLRAADAFTIICVLLYDRYGAHITERNIAVTGTAPSVLTDLPLSLRPFVPRDLRRALKWPPLPTSL